MSTAQSRINTREIYEIIAELNSPMNVVKLFAKCFDDVIYARLKKHYDVKLFFEYLKKKNNNSWMGLLSEVNRIIKNNKPNYSEEIDQILDRIPAERVKYSIHLLLEYIKKIKVLDETNFNLFSKELGSINIPDNVIVGEIIDTIDDVFNKHTGRSYSYFSDRYDHYINKKYIQYLFDKWKAPKFKISSGSLPPERRRQQTFVPQTVIAGDPRLQKLQQMLEKKEENTLKRDKEILASKIPAGYEQAMSVRIFDFWENNMYVALSGKKPRQEEREALLAATVWVYLKVFHRSTMPITDFIKDQQRIEYAKNMYNKINPTWFTISQKYDNLFTIIRNAGIEENIINKIKERFTQENPTYKKDKEEIIYRETKNISRLKITRNLIKDWINQSQ